MSAENAVARRGLVMESASVNDPTSHLEARSAQDARLEL